MHIVFPFLALPNNTQHIQQQRKYKIYIYLLMSCSQFIIIKTNEWIFSILLLAQASSILIYEEK